MWRWLLAAGVVWGCTCSAPLPPCELFDRSRAVFSGVVLDTNEDGRGGFSKTTLYLVRVEEGFRGLAPEQKEVFVDPGSFTSCYTYFEVGKKYLFYAGPGAIASVSFTGRRGEAVAFPSQWQEKKDLKVYSVPMCSGSKDWHDAQEDVDWIRSRLRGETSTRVFGQAVQRISEFRRGDVDRISGQVDRVDRIVCRLERRDRLHDVLQHDRHAHKRGCGIRSHAERRADCDLRVAAS